MEKTLFDELKKIVDLNESSDNLDNKCVAAILCTILGADLDNKLEELSLIVVAFSKRQCDEFYAKLN